MSDYIDPDTATRLRVFDDAFYDGFAIDAIDNDGGYVEYCWTHDEITDAPIATVERAVELAQEFAATNAPQLVGTKPKITASALTLANDRAEA